VLQSLKRGLGEVAAAFDEERKHHLKASLGSRRGKIINM